MKTASIVCNAFQSAAYEVAKTVKDASTDTVFELKKSNGDAEDASSLLDIARGLIGVDD